MGRYELSFSEVTGALAEFVRSVFSGLTGDPAGNSPSEGSGITAECYAVVTELRLPRLIAAAFAGAALSASGAAYQGIFRNPLVSPGLLGVSAGAGFGAALAILLFGGGTMSYLLAFVFGIGAVLLSYWIAGIYESVPTIMLVLGGTIVTSVFNALVSLLKYVADTDSELPAIVYWLMGSLASAGWSTIWAVIPVGIGLLVLICRKLAHQCSFNGRAGSTDTGCECEIGQADCHCGSNPGYCRSCLYVRCGRLGRSCDSAYFPDDYGARQ